ncbi:glycoside hydrolase family 3 protein [Nakamurella sp.]|uniref:glycoside hydrolase family 3 protein n=1 Tax=Nakamurella sp. TaxID=1869182 RepID=UPI00378361B3
MVARGRFHSTGRRFAARTLAGATAAALLLAGCAATPEQGPPPSIGDTPSASSAAGPSSPPATSVPATMAPAASGTSAAEPTGSPLPSPPPEPPPAPAVPPGGPVTGADMTAAAAAVAAMSTADRAGTVVMASSADAVGTDLVARLHLGGVILMGSKGAIDGTADGTPPQVAAVAGDLQAQVPADQAGAPLLIGTDQESGLVTRLVNGFTDFPGADELSGIADPDAAAALTEQVTAASAAEMRAVGINVDFAPDADVPPESGVSGVAERTFGSDPDRSARLVGAAVRGYQQGGVAATIKHFPGIGRTATDTHKALPTLDIDCPEWNAVEAVPMRGGVDAGAALVMTGHIDLPAVGTAGASSALSSAVVTDLLKGSGVAGCDGLNFHGVAVSDSFQMAPIKNNFGPEEAAWRGVAAGQDLVLMPTDPEAAVSGIVAAVDGGQLSGERLTDAATRVYALRLALGRTPAPGLDTVGSADHEAIAARARAAG